MAFSVFILKKKEVKYAFPVAIFQSFVETLTTCFFIGISMA